MSECRWKEDADGIYQTECGHSFFFDTDGASENGCKFCCYCGASLIDVKFVDEAAERQGEG